MEDQHRTEEEWPAALVVGPRDELIVTLPASTSARDLDFIAGKLAEKFATRVTVIVGAEQMAVIKSGQVPHGE